MQLQGMLFEPSCVGNQHAGVFATCPNQLRMQSLRIMKSVMQSLFAEMQFGYSIMRDTKDTDVLRSFMEPQDIFMLDLLSNQMEVCP